MDTDKYPIYVTDWKISGAFKQLRGFLRQQELCSESDPSPQVDVLMAWIDKQMTGYQLLEPSASPYGKPEEKEEYRQLTLPFL